MQPVDVTFQPPSTENQNSSSVPTFREASRRTLIVQSLFFCVRCLAKILGLQAVVGGKCYPFTPGCQLEDILKKRLRLGGRHDCRLVGVVVAVVDLVVVVRDWLCCGPVVVVVVVVGKTYL